MATNHYFNNTRANNEQNLVEDLIIESIKIHGQDILYLPRTVVNKHSLFGEDPLSAFRSAKVIEMFMENVQGFGGAGDVIGKWGLELQDTASFTVSKKRFQKETGMLRPLEGDLIYYPMTKGYFEIKFVEHESPFFQLGKNYVFKMSTELFQFNEETFETGEAEIDSIADLAQFRLFLTYGTTGSGSTAFSVGETVYQYKNGATGGGATSADATGIVKEISGNVIGISNLVGSWLPSSSTVNRYVISSSGSSYRVVTGTDDRVLRDDYDDNKDIQDRSDEDLDFTIVNPFGTP